MPEGKFPEDDIRFYITQVTLAVQEMHRLSLVHRDVKLQNVMVNEDGYVKLIDFGLSRLFEHGELMSEAAGTPFYQSVEQHEAQKYDHTVDFWALGILMYEMRFGNHPFASGKGGFHPDIEAMKTCTI